MDKANHDVVVFVSHKVATAGETAKLLIEKLEQRGIKGFYCSRDCEDDPSDDFVIPIVDAIEQCRLFLFLLDKASNVSDHCFNEIKLACDRAYRNKDLILVVYRLDDSAYSKTIRYYLSRKHCINGTNPPIEQRMEELADKICHYLETGPSGSEEEYSSLPTNALVPSIVYPEAGFIGREKEIKQIRDILRGERNKLILVGMGGIGKSEIAKKYALVHRKDYDVICWIPFHGTIKETFADDNAVKISGLSRKDYAGESDHDYAMRKLSIMKSTASERTLLVLDNFSGRDDKDLDELLHGKYAILFTSRERNLCKTVPDFQIEAMQDKDELLRLFQENYVRELDEEGIQDVNQIIDSLHGHTLMIRLISSAMQHKRIGPKKLLLSLKGENEDDKANTAIGGALGDLESVLGLSALSEKEIRLLINLSLIPLSGIEVEDLYDWSGFFELDEDYEVIDSLVERSWVISDCVSDKVHLHPLITELIAKKLVGADDIIAPLLQKIQTIVRDQLSYSYQKKLSLVSLTDSICERLPKDSRHHYEMIFTNALACSDALLGDKARIGFAYAYEHAGNFFQKMRSCHYLSQKEYLDGNYEKAYEIGMEGYREFKDMDPATWPKDAGPYCDNVLQRIGEAARAMGRYEEALEWFKKAEGPCALYPLKSVHHSLGWLHYQLADTLLKMGRHDEAKAHAKTSIQTFEQGEDFWSKACALDLFKKLCLAKGETREAIRINEERILLLSKYDGEASTIGIHEENGDLLLVLEETEQSLREYQVALALCSSPSHQEDAARLRKKIEADTH